MLDYGEALFGDYCLPRREGIQYPNVVVKCLATYYMHEYKLENTINKFNNPAMFYHAHPEVLKYPILYDKDASSPFAITSCKILTNLPKSEFTSEFYNEVFYTMRVSQLFDQTYGVPCRQLFYLYQFAKQFNNEFVWLPKIYPKKLLDDLCSENYIKSGYDPCGLIAALFNVDFRPIMRNNPSCPCDKDGMWSYVYVTNTDTLAKFPKELMQRIPSHELYKLQYKDGYIFTSQKAVHEYLPGCRGLYLSHDPYIVDVI